MTAQIVNFALEVIVPYVKREGFRTAKKMKAKRAARIGGTYENHAANDAPNEAAFLKRVRDEAELEDYDVTGDFREMIVQFGIHDFLFNLRPVTNEIRISFTFFCCVASNLCVLPRQQLDRTAWGCIEDCVRMQTTSTMES